MYFTIHSIVTVTAGKSQGISQETGGGSAADYWDAAETER